MQTPLTVGSTSPQWTVRTKRGSPTALQSGGPLLSAARPWRFDLIGRGYGLSVKVFNSFPHDSFAQLGISCYVENKTIHTAE